jgi:hypothetical protein
MIGGDFTMIKTSLKDKEFYETMHYLKMEREKHNNFKSLKDNAQIKGKLKKKKIAYDNYVLVVSSRKEMNDLSNFGFT